MTGLFTTEITISHSDLNAMVKASTAFGRMSEMIQACSEGYVPTLDETDGNHVIIAAALRTHSFKVYWR